MIDYDWLKAKAQEFSAIAEGTSKGPVVSYEARGIDQGEFMRFADELAEQVIKTVAEGWAAESIETKIELLAHGRSLANLTVATAIAVGFDLGYAAAMEADLGDVPDAPMA